jgi:hypothetical protein
MASNALLERPRTRTGVLSLRFGVDGPLVDGARDCERAVFLDAFGNTAEQLHDEYGPYDAQSAWLTVSDPEGTVVGACRLIVPGPAGLKTLNDLSRAPWRVDGRRSVEAAGADVTRTWDIATLGVRPDRRGSRARVSLALFHGILKAARANGARTVTAIFDEPARRVVSTLGYPLLPLPGTSTAPYLGSAASTPVYFHGHMLDAVRRNDPDAHRLVTMGVGLDGIDVPAESDWLLARGEEHVTAAA